MTTSLVHVAFSISLVVLFSVSLFVSLDFREGARIYPLATSWVGLAFSIVHAVISVHRHRRERRAAEGVEAVSDAAKAHLRGATTDSRDFASLKQLGMVWGNNWMWLGLLVGLFLLFGMVLGGAFYLFAFLALRARASLWFQVSSVMVVTVALILLARGIGLELVEGIFDPLGLSRVLER